ncbi:MAG: hypothetical protein AMJ38_05075, partial [Dehalococcoidia bacterium DG_22]
MKRFALATILLTAAGVAVFLALNRPGAEASPDVWITVNSTDDSSVRDGKLTLTEAIMLATDDLDVGDLDHGECDQVGGTLWLPYPILDCTSLNPPGAASADTIVFDTSVFPPGSAATISIDFDLPALNTGHDTVDGSSAGVVVEASWAASEIIYCFE